MMCARLFFFPSARLSFFLFVFLSVFLNIWWTFDHQNATTFSGFLKTSSFFVLNKNCLFF
jgi:hypothetical protein